MCKLVKFLLIYLSLEWLLRNKQVYSLSNRLNVLDDDQKCRIIDSRSLNSDDNLYYLVDFIKQDQHSNHEFNHFNQIDLNDKFNSYDVRKISKLNARFNQTFSENSFVQNLSNRKFNYSIDHIDRWKKSISKNLRNDSIEFSSLDKNAQREFILHLVLLNNLPDVRHINQNNLLNFLYKPNEKTNQNDLNDKNRIKLNLINYPLKLSSSCLTNQEPSIIETINYHLNIVNKCINHLIQSNFCYDSTDVLQICERLVKRSILEFKQINNSSCFMDLNFENILKLFEKTINELESTDKLNSSSHFNEFSPIEPHDEETNSNLNKLIAKNHLVIYLIHKKSNSSKLICSQDLVNRFDFIESTISLSDLNLWTLKIKGVIYLTSI